MRSHWGWVENVIGGGDKVNGDEWERSLGMGGKGHWGLM